MKAYMEHINITVQNLEDTLKFFQTAFPSFRIRGEGQGASGKWVHFGTDDTYIAISTAGRSAIANNGNYATTGLNHVGFVVEDVKALGRRLQEAGFKRSYPVQNQRFRIRDYFLDHEGNEYEFVEYLSDKPEERNDYSD